MLALLGGGHTVAGIVLGVFGSVLAHFDPQRQFGAFSCAVKQSKLCTTGGCRGPYFVLFSLRDPFHKVVAHVNCGLSSTFSHLLSLFASRLLCVAGGGKKWEPIQGGKPDCYNSVGAPFFPKSIPNLPRYTSVAPATPVGMVFNVLFDSWSLSLAAIGLGLLDAHVAEQVCLAAGFSAGKTSMGCSGERYSGTTTSRPSMKLCLLQLGFFCIVCIPGFTFLCSLGLGAILAVAMEGWPVWDGFCFVCAVAVGATNPYVTSVPTTAAGLVFTAVIGSWVATPTTPYPHVHRSHVAICIAGNVLLGCSMLSILAPGFGRTQQFLGPPRAFGRKCGC